MFIYLLCIYIVMEIDNYTTKIIKAGNSFYVIIPSNIVKFGGYKKGDVLKVYIKKWVQNEITNNNKGMA